MSRWLLAVFFLAWGAALADRYEPKAVTWDATRLHTYSTVELIDLLSRSSFDHNNYATVSDTPTPRYYWQDVEDELVARRDAKSVLRAFRETDDRYQQYDLADVFARLQDPVADKALHRFVGPGLNDRAMIATLYFGRRCEPAALAILTKNFGHYPTSSLEAASLAEVFGTCRYKPAAKKLAHWVGAASLNLGVAAHEALTKIYPDAGITDCRSPEDCADRWHRYLAGKRLR